MSKQNNKSFYQRNTYNTNNWWKPGQPITESDELLLAEVKAFYREHGYVPKKNEISNMGKLKQRFRTWKNVLIAAGLPSQHDPEWTKIRQLLKEEKGENQDGSAD